MQRGQPLHEITKANGERSTFDPKKLYGSPTRSGAGEPQAHAIVDIIINSELYPGISTKKIYKRAFSLLKECYRFLAARYNLKHAIMLLGPSGYPF